jgi:signal transduction histidine kinase
MKRAADARAIADEADAALTGQPPPRPPDRLALSRRADQIQSLAKLAAQLPDSPELREQTERLSRLADRAGALAEYVRTFGWPSTQEPTVLDIRRPLNLALEVVLPELRHRARLSIELEEAPRVRAVEQELAHCFFDLLMNATQAIDKGAPERNLIEVSTCGRDDGFALVTVRDSGCGIPSEILPRIFDPMFTTKSADGQGLGLYLCQVTMASLGGEIFVDSEPGNGSVFTLAFPPAGLS